MDVYNSSKTKKKKKKILGPRLEWGEIRLQQYIYQQQRISLTLSSIVKKMDFATADLMWVEVQRTDRTFMKIKIMYKLPSSQIVYMLYTVSSVLFKEHMFKKDKAKD